MALPWKLSQNALTWNLRKHTLRKTIEYPDPVTFQESSGEESEENTIHPVNLYGPPPVKISTKPADSFNDDAMMDEEMPSSLSKIDGAKWAWMACKMHISCFYAMQSKKEYETEVFWNNANNYSVEASSHDGAVR